MKSYITVFAVWFSFLLCMHSKGNAQTDTLQMNTPNEVKIGLTKSYFKSYLYDTKDVFIAPFRWTPRQYLIAGGVLATTGSLLLVDDNVQVYSQSIRTPLSNKISKHGLEPWGGGMYSFPLLGAFGLHSYITGNQRSKRVFLLGAKSASLAALTVTVLKFTFERHRPWQNVPANPYLWEGPAGKFQYRSFPSGHTITAFSIAGIIAAEYRDKPWVGILAYSLAGLSGLSRIHDNKHWASDVFMGASLGIGISQMVYFKNNWGIKTYSKRSKCISQYL